jgi:hypothetical protein
MDLKQHHRRRVVKIPPSSALEPKLDTSPGCTITSTSAGITISISSTFRNSPRPSKAAHDE